MGLSVNYQAVIEDTQELLRANKVEWQERYSGYAKNIAENEGFIRDIRSKFHEWSPLKLYLTTTYAKEAKKKVMFDLRYLGQTVANLIGDNEGILLSTEKYDSNNERDFDCKIKVSNESWNGKESQEFRAFFRNRLAGRNKSKKNNEEHRLESLLLTEFSKTEEKTMTNIKPVEVAGVRFPMPTPLKASDPNTVEYAKQNGGGIDILARTGIGHDTHLCIMELKDENKKSDPPAIILKQAIKYTVFIRELLRSEAGEDWWKLFGFGKAIPEKLVLFAVCVMPDGDGTDISFAGDEYEICGDVIKLHFVYFQETDNKIEKIRTSLPYAKKEC